MGIVPDMLTAGIHHILFPVVIRCINEIVRRKDSRSVIDGDAAEQHGVRAADHATDVLSHQ
jgi:hypothetical protein